MPLSQVQRQQCRIYTGRTRVNAQVDRTLENALDAVDALGVSDPSAGAELLASIAALLTELVAVDAQVTASRSRAKFTKVEDVTFAGGGELAVLRSQGRQLVGRLCTQLGVPRGHDAFGGEPLGGLMRQG